jgi:hypothetical protein
MPTSYSDLLRFAKQANAENSGTWGTILNDNTLEILEQAIADVATISATGSGDITLTTANGSTDQARCAVLKFTGTPIANRNVIVPAANKIYIVHNACSAAFSMVIKIGAGATQSFAQNERGIVYSDGTDVFLVIKTNSSGAIGSVAANAIDTAAIQTGAVTTAKLADGNVTTVKIADSNVTTAKIADSNVTTAKIADANVTYAKLASAAIAAASDLIVGTASKLVTAATFKAYRNTPPIIRVQHAEASGNNGGVRAAVYTWVTRTINNAHTNNISGASLAANTVTLPAGTYKVTGYQFFFSTAQSRGRVYNTTDSVSVVVSSSAYASGSSGSGLALYDGVFTIAAPKDFVIQYWVVGTSGGSSDLGIASGTGDTEVYADIIFEKIG